MIQNDNSTTSISFVFRLLAHAVNDSCNCLVHMHVDVNLSPSVIFMRAKGKYCQLAWARKIATQYGLAIACLLSTVNVSVADGKMDLYCGPRCVQRVLDDYGYESDLLSLVKEIQCLSPVKDPGLTVSWRRWSQEACTRRQFKLTRRFSSAGHRQQFFKSCSLGFRIMLFGCRLTIQQRPPKYGILRFRVN